MEWRSTGIWHGWIRFETCYMCCIIRATNLYEIYSGKHHLINSELNSLGIWRFSRLCFDLKSIGSSSSAFAANSCNQLFIIFGSYYGDCATFYAKRSLQIGKYNSIISIRKYYKKFISTAQVCSRNGQSVRNCVLASKIRP